MSVTGKSATGIGAGAGGEGVVQDNKEAARTKIVILRILLQHNSGFAFWPLNQGADNLSDHCLINFTPWKTQSPRHFSTLGATLLLTVGNWLHCSALRSLPASGSRRRRDGEGGRGTWKRTNCFSTAAHFIRDAVQFSITRPLVCPCYWLSWSRFRKGLQSS